jgi:ribonuclease III
MITKIDIEKLTNKHTESIDLYEQAFTHKSSTEDSLASNERLEFIGDSVLSLVVTKYLYEKYPNENEGFLTRIRTKIVSGKSLSKIALDLGFDRFILMNEKGMRNEWYKNARILEDSLESFIGAIFLDAGLNVSQSFIMKYIVLPMNNDELLEDNNFKDILMRYTQGRKLDLPEYKLYCEVGSTGAKMFVVQVFIKNKLISEGIHRIKKQAEQKAAKRALQCFNII